MLPLLDAGHLIIPLTTSLVNSAEPLRIRVPGMDRLRRSSDILRAGGEFQLAGEAIALLSNGGTETGDCGERGLPPRRGVAAVIFRSSARAAERPARCPR